GSSIGSAVGLLIARVAGAALISIGIACWLAHTDEKSKAAKGLAAALLFYNATVTLLLAYSVFSIHMSGVGIWPAVVLHFAMAGWCIKCLLSGQAKKRLSIQNL